MSHSYSKNYVHAIYSTKDRQNLIPPEFEKRLYSFIASIAREHEIPLLAAGGMSNHPSSLSAACNNFVGIRNQYLQDELVAIHARTGPRV